MRKRYSLIKLLDGVRTISDLTRAIAELTYLKINYPMTTKYIYRLRVVVLTYVFILFQRTKTTANTTKH